MDLWKNEVSDCSDSQLVMQLQHLTHSGQKLVARLIVYIGEMDARGLYREHAFPSMFHYLIGELRMSEAEACLRLQAARLARQYPAIIELLASGAVHLSALRLIAPLLTPDNHAQLLQRVRGKTKREVMQLVAELAPKPEVHAEIRKLPQRGLPLVAAAVVPAPSAENSPMEPQAAAAARVAPEQVTADDSAAFALEAPREKKRGRCTPVGPGRYEMKLPIDQELYETLEQLRHLLRHRVPDGDLTLIVALAAKRLLSHELKQRFAQTPARASRRVSAKAASPATSRDARTAEAEAEATETSTSNRRGNNTNTRHVPNEVKREVYARDGSQCTFVSASGRRCSERGGLEFHHIHAFALGGRATADNLKLMCRAHNCLLAEHDFGRDVMRRKISRAAPGLSNDYLLCPE